MSFGAARMSKSPFGTRERAKALGENALLSRVGGKTA